MNSRKVWTASSIRKLARQRQEEFQNRSQTEKPLASEPGLAAPSTIQKLFEEPIPRRVPEQPAELEWMWGRFEKSRGHRVLLSSPADESESQEEMRQLCETLGLEVVCFHEHNPRHHPSPATYLGSGALEKLGAEAADASVAAIVIDAPLTPVQVRNMEEILKSPVVDRQGVILAIFELHAKSKLAKMQVELARLKYLQPRLSGLWMGLSRTTGSKGGLKGRGLGETRLELDRRVVKDRISFLSKKLKESQKAFDVQSSRRAHLPRVALVGYTNAGKSTLMKALTKADVVIEDQLFCTLDTTVRPLNPPTDPRILISDTVGFVRDLPHDLIASFQSTLREALGSGLILHVVDVSHSNWIDHFETSESVLEEVHAAEIPRLLVLNKGDLVGDAGRLQLNRAVRLLAGDDRFRGQILVSAQTGEGLTELRSRLIDYFNVGDPLWRGVEHDICGPK